MMVPEFARIAALAGEPARAAMLAMLFDGRAMPAGQLAHGAGISAATASVHLTKMVEAGLLSVRSQGRHRYYQFSCPDVVEALERLGSIAPLSPVRSLRDSLRSRRLRAARTCYNHLAGELALALVNVLIQRGAIEPEENGFRLDVSARPVFLELGVDTRRVFATDRAHVKACIDWTERRHHISGPLGAAILKALLEQDVVRRRDEPRALETTPHGRDVLAGFGVSLTPA